MNSLGTLHDEVVGWFRNPRQNGTGVKATCPNHDDQKQSLHISLGDDGRVLLFCHAGCATEDVLARIGKTTADLFPPRATAPPSLPPTYTAYDYRDADNTLVFQAVRKQYPDGQKEFFQRRPKPGGGWITNLQGVQRVPYRLPELLAASVDECVVVLEGEKDADRAIALGFTATTNAGGAGKFGEAEAQYLHGRHVVLVPDNDQAGYQHMLKVARMLDGKAASITIVQLTTVRPKGDLSDYIDDGVKVDDLDSLFGGRRSKLLGAKLINIDELATLAGETRQDADGPAEATDQAAGLLRFRTAREIAEATPEQPDWIVEPWIVAGGVTELSGKIKAGGKTTLITHMCRAALDGEPFLGKPTSRTPVVFLTEQADSSLREAMRRADLLDRDDFVVLSYYDARHLAWPEIVAATVAHARTIGARLIVVDTLPQWAGIRGEGENSSGEALRAMEPLQAAAGMESIAVVVVRHDRKSGGDVGDSARGSSAFGGAVDIVMQVQRNEGNSRPTIRVINALSRYDETPDQLVVELTEGGYVSHGDKAAVATEEARAAIIKAAPSTEATAKTVDDLATIADVKRTTAHDTVKYLFERGQLCRVGTGYRGSPFRYWRPDAGRDRIDSSVLKVEVPDESNSSDSRMETKGFSIDSSGTHMAPDESISQPATVTPWTRNSRAIDSSGTSTLGTDESISDQHRVPSERAVITEFAV
ncbi:MAG: AAA family ATPase [Chloroflexota bacterium]|nr:AAA family ATPase [Chloroflexota bacterium]